MAANQTQQCRHVPLVDGPSKFDLMLALFDRKPHTRVLTFEAGGGQKIEARVVSVQVEDGSGESWNIVVSILSPVYADRIDNCLKWDPTYQLYFRTDRRKGCLLMPEDQRL